MWTVVRSVVPYLSRDFREALLEYEKETEGKKAAKARWLSCVEDLNSYTHGLTFALGYLWVKNVFDVEIIPFVSKASIDTDFAVYTKEYPVTERVFFKLPLASLSKQVLGVRKYFLANVNVT